MMDCTGAGNVPTGILEGGNTGGIEGGGGCAPCEDQGCIAAGMDG